MAAISTTYNPYIDAIDSIPPPALGLCISNIDLVIMPIIIYT